MPVPESYAPYKGLIPYNAEDAPFFFGRERETRLITANLFASPLTLLYGESGVGKSSVLRAGVVRQLLSRDDLHVIIFSSWRGDPVANLKRALNEAVAPNDNRDMLISDSLSLSQYLAECAKRLDRRLMIILDQFEEYFLYHEQEDGEGRFAFEFAQAVRNQSININFLISIREDAYTKLDRFEGRIPNLFNNNLRIEHLKYEAAREAIIKPIDQYNRLQPTIEQPVSIEDELVDEVLKEIATGRVVLGEAGRGAVERKYIDSKIETPFLQLVMMRLWDEEMRSSSRTLRLATLIDLGGSDRIVRTHLDVAMRELNLKEQHIAVTIYNYLITPSGTKIAHTATDLALFSGSPTPDVTYLLEKLSSSESRILRRVEALTDQSTEPRYEIYHDVLGPAILDWRARYAQAMERAEAERKLEQEKQKAEQEAQQLLQRIRQRARYQRNILGIAILVGLIMLGLAIYANEQKHREEQAKADLQIAYTKNIEALDLLHSYDQAVPYFRSIMRGHSSAVNSGAFSPNGRLAVTSGQDATARLWDVESGKSIFELRGHEEALNSAIFSPDGGLVVTASNDGTARVWDTQTGESLSVLKGHTDRVNNAIFSPNGELILTASSDGAARVWEAMTARPIAELSGHSGQVTSADFSPNGKLIVTTSVDRTARVWDSKTYKSVAVMIGHTDWVISAAFSPDGRRVITASEDKTARIWDVSGGRNLAELRGHISRVNSAAFSPDGKLAITASGDRTSSGDATARVWNIDELPGFRVSNVLLKAIPTSYKGYCPVTITFLGRISVIGGYGIVKYRFVRMNGEVGTERTLTFDTPGSKEVSATWKFGGINYPSLSGAFYLEVTYPQQVRSNEAEFKLECENFTSNILSAPDNLEAVSQNKDPVTSTSDVALKWEPVLGAAKYIVEVEYLERPFSCRSLTVVDTTTVLSRVDPVRFRWRVYAADSNGRPGSKSVWASVKAR